jgi:hypothetical protein
VSAQVLMLNKKGFREDVDLSTPIPSSECDCFGFKLLEECLFGCNKSRSASAAEMLSCRNAPLRDATAP